MRKIIVHVRLNGVHGRNELNGIFRYLARKEGWDFRIPRRKKNLAFIAANAATNLKVNDVVIHLGVSRRLADQRFHQFQKESILSAITRTRIEELKRLLRETDAPIGRITADCGFLNASYAKTLFLSKVGQTMTAYRNAKQALR